MVILFIHLLYPPPTHWAVAWTAGQPLGQRYSRCGAPAWLRGPTGTTTVRRSSDEAARDSSLTCSTTGPAEVAFDGAASEPGC